MPELPEVETVRCGLEKLLVGKQILAVEVYNEESLQTSADDIKEIIIGGKIIAVRRRAKMLFIDLDNGNTLWCHLKMTGQMVYRGKTDWGGGHPNDSFLNELPDRTTRVGFELDGGDKLFFNDQRKFGWIKLVPTAEIDEAKAIKGLGPEPINCNDEAMRVRALDGGVIDIADVDDKLLTDFTKRIRRHTKMSVKAAILDQTVIAGVGNIYADESLWLAQIHPLAKVGTLTDADIARLLASIQTVLIRGLNAGGSTARNYVKADGTRGDYLDKFAAAYNRTGQPCKRCGHEIEKIKVAGRGTHICSVCQQL